MIQRITTAEARERWDELVRAVADGGTRVIVENGDAAVAIISATDLARIQRQANGWDEPFKALDASRAAFAGVPPDEIEREAAAAVAAAREEMRKESQRATKSA